MGIDRKSCEAMLRRLRSPIPLAPRRGERVGVRGSLNSATLACPASGSLSTVIPAKAGIQGKRLAADHVALDSRFRGNDGRKNQSALEGGREAPYLPFFFFALLLSFALPLP